MTDPIVDEVHRYRREYAAKFGFDVHKIAADAMEREAKSGHRVVSFTKEGVRQGARLGRSRVLSGHSTAAKHRRQVSATATTVAKKRG